MNKSSSQIRRLDFELESRGYGQDEPIPVIISSDDVVEVSDGPEILVHSPDAVDLTRAPLPIVATHRGGQVNVGIVDRISIRDGKMRGLATFGTRAEATEYRQDVINKIIRSVSIGYSRIKASLRKDGVLVTSRWMPFHVAMVAEPADPNAGFFRSSEPFPKFELEQEEQPVSESVIVQQPADNATTRRAAMADKEQTVAGETADVKQMNPIEMEQRRKQAIENLCKTNKLDDNYRDMWIGQGASLEQVAEDMVKIFEERGKTNPTSIAKIGLTEKETREFSLAKAINACASRDWKGADFELEAIKAVAQRMGKTPDPHKFYVPFEVLMRKMPTRNKRDLTVASSGGGGYLVATDNMGFIDMLYNRSVAFNMGVRRMSGLTSSITIPRMSASGTAYWLASESTAATESQQTFQQVSMTPKTAAAYTEISRQLLLQSSPGAEGIVTDDLAQIVATAADLAVLNGAGANGEPDGIIGFSGVGSVAAGSLNYAAVLEFQTDVASSKVRPQAGGYVTTAAVAAIAKQRQRFSSTDTPLWTGNIWDGQIEGFRAMSSEQVPSATMIFGDWSEIVVGEWGVLEVEVNPYANFQAGIIGVRCMYTMDVGIRRPYAFSIMQTIS